MGKVSSDKISLSNKLNQQINPATEDSLQALLGLYIPKHDYISVEYPSGLQEIYTYKIGGVDGTVVAVITVNYTDNSKQNLSSISKS